jgi:hypothetical protein
MSVSTYFKEFSDKLLIGSIARSRYSTRYLAICRRLNIDFWGHNVTSGGRYIGSYGRNTANNWFSDIDMLFEMPWTEYWKYDGYLANGQSALLQAVKNSISTTYSTSKLKGDGQIVSVDFLNDPTFEVLPVFKNSDGTYIFADSNGNGSWKKTNPIPEIQSISTGDILTNSNLRRLCRMARAWKHYCSVPIKGLLIDTLAYRFLTNWSHRDKSYTYYDWMSRDFFKFLKEQNIDQTIWYAIGSSQPIYNNGNFRYKATQAYNKSLEAIQYQSDNKEWSSKQKWKQIYGNRFPD